MTSIEWVRGKDGSKGISLNAFRAERNAVLGGRCVRVSANHCEHVNEACRHCYAGDFNPRHGGLPFKRQHRDQYDFVLDKKRLLAPLRRKKPTRIFVESMSDAFGEWWPRKFVDRLYAVMALTPQHTYINLSKRPARRRTYLDRAAFRVVHEAHRIYLTSSAKRPPDGLITWPLPNVIEGTSVSCQEEADNFVPELLATKCAVRCVSAEPLLGPIEFARRGWLRCAGDVRPEPPYIDWVIVGGESGSRARPMHPDWARDIRDQCEAAGAAFFFKQRGAYTWIDERDDDNGSIPELPGNWRERTDDKYICMRADGSKASGYGGDSAEFLYRVGKKKAGRLLDGRTYDDFPRVAA